MYPYNAEISHTFYRVNTLACHWRCSGEPSQGTVLRLRGTIHRHIVARESIGEGISLTTSGLT